MAIKARKLAYRVTGNILHGGKLHTAGDTITFDPTTDQTAIDELKKIGVLEGPDADRIMRERLLSEAAIGVRGMTAAELEKIWSVYQRMNQVDQVERERQEARLKEDADAARLANIADTQDTADEPEE